MTLSKERLEEIADGYTPSHQEYVGLARELLERRERDKQEPVRNPVLAYADNYREMANRGVESVPIWSFITDLERNIAPLFTTQPAPVAQPELTVWYGAMPESNGKTNWTAILRRKDDGCRVFTIDCSEYPDRVRYEADRMRWMIGKLPEEPDILSYDEHLHTGYVPPAAQPVQLPEPITRNDSDGWWMYNGRRVGGGCAEWYNLALEDCRAAMPQAKPTDDERIMAIEGISVVKLPPEFYSGVGRVVQIEKVMAALAVAGIEYERPQTSPQNIPENIPQWIPCSERMPEVKSTVLVYMNEPQHSATDYAVADFDKYGFSRSKVTHWMPLPAAPQEPTK